LNVGIARQSLTRLCRSPGGRQATCKRALACFEDVGCWKRDTTSRSG